MMERAHNYLHGKYLKETGQSDKMANRVISESFGISLNEKLIKLHENEDKKIFYVTKLQKDNPHGYQPHNHFVIGLVKIYSNGMHTYGFCGEAIECC